MVTHTKGLKKDMLAHFANKDQSYWHADGQADSERDVGV